MGGNYKMKTIKILYSGDASSKEELTIGDCLTIHLLEKAMTYLFKKNRCSGIKFDIPKEQLSNLVMSDCSLYFFNVFNKAKIKILYKRGKTQETIVRSGTNQVKIYTHKE